MRAQIDFLTLRDRDDITIIPGDVAPLIASGQLDRGLFDVTQLIADGYSDRDRDDLPLIVTATPAGPARPAMLPASADVIVDRVIRVLGVTAVRQRKTSAGAVLAMLQPAA